ncbi:MAG: bifunctional phosphopantothenoylcysteine decarboxylase/phosphopantothenate--cysteine ligase CoaBC [Gammaproteobacteria bacterium]|nr:bifunctional phosphopantothenoylcysteine decarboxylase/phosphopantothenate--cysteine ligase CoaBC [Gammaproteobacteria bacterium]MDG1952925.1 bifunctional phosphopantothenoylcysteine decarboxylase/phosphopantothenate--cysteine ligase CoaBC [Gammaproteobacteria bacterium]MDG2118956.1 bifunctional phosphopantothenoylcysteine decarboxylase/phosphopantothenate--cysteine ligase CoaBC [Gammaproteobacteria bacterium]
MLPLANKRIILGITGGIAAYKCAELTRGFVKAGADVKIVMTKSAEEFVTPLTLQALSGNRVHQNLLDIEAEAAMGHIELARWADIIIIAPATANFIARAAQGKAEDLLTTILLATPSLIAIAPAMNVEMWTDKQTQTNVEILRKRDVIVLGPSSGSQACGDVGLGRMLEPELIIDSVTQSFQTDILTGRKILITGGPTREAIDPVRYISNHSSGKMAYALASEAVNAGAEVLLVSGPVMETVPERVTCLKVTSADEMLHLVLSRMQDVDIFIGVAAIADYRPAKKEKQKIKKHKNQIDLTLIKNPDIISEVASLPNRPYIVGFAAETENILENGIEKLTRKNLDLLFANDATETFGSDVVASTAIFADENFTIKSGKKSAVARHMLQIIANKLPAN